MSFASDNAAPAHPAILSALADANVGVAPSYGADEWTARATRALEAVFETRCAVLLVATGTAANALSLAAMSPPWGAVFCHRHAHIAEDEGGAPEFYTGGAKLLLLDGPSGKVEPSTLTAAASRYSRANVHGAQPFALSITQATESGASYTPNEIAALCEAARSVGLKVHMDGARFANALAHQGCSPAAMTWRAGVDILSFGATKNGAFGVEAIVCFDTQLATALPHLRKRAGHLFSKHRYLGAQMAAYLHEDLWLKLARNANARAQELATVFAARGVSLAHPVGANAVFARLSTPQVAALRSAGVAFHPWVVDGADVHRFVASWATVDDDIARVAAALDGC